MQPSPPEEGMTFVQRLVTALLPPHWADAIRAESQSWLYRCLACGDTRSVWEAGGIRFKAAAKGKRTLVWCPQCGQARLMAVERKAAD